MNSKQKFRIRLIGLGVLFGAFVLMTSLYRTSISNGDKYAEKAEAQYSKPATAIFARGTIYFSDKDGTQTAAATVGTGFVLYMNPKLITDPNGTYEALSHFVTLDMPTFLTKAKKANDPYEELLHHIDEDTANSIRALKMPGIGIVPESWRSYPGGVLAAHELGLIGENAASSTIGGKYGLERYYNNILSRESTGPSMNVFAQLFSGLSSVFGAASEGNIVTSIEPRVEAYLDKVITDAEKTWKPDEIGGIIMDPETGEVIALSSHPSFDPNNLKATKNVAVFSNPLVEHVYEMGSIMKPLTMAAALDSDSVKVNTTYDDVGCMTLDEKKICNYDGKARGVIPMQEILSQSLNIGAATIAMKMGSEPFSAYFHSFGIGSKSLIDLPNESTPLTNNLKNPRDIDVATASYGQGIAISPIGMIRALAVIANGGYVVNPRIVKEIDYEDGRNEKIPVVKTGPVLKTETIDDVRRMLVTVVDTALAKGAIKKEHYSVAAKTGTAEIADHVNGGYYHDRYLHSFFGFFPAYKPRFIVFLYQIYPKGAKYASETLVKPFDDLSTFLLNYYNIPPDR